MRQETNWSKYKRSISIEEWHKIANAHTHTVRYQRMNWEKWQMNANANEIKCSSDCETREHTQKSSSNIQSALSFWALVPNSMYIPSTVTSTLTRCQYEEVLSTNALNSFSLLDFIRWNAKRVKVMRNKNEKKEKKKSTSTTMKTKRKKNKNESTKMLKRSAQQIASFTSTLAEHLQSKTHLFVVFRQYFFFVFERACVLFS